MSFSIDRRALLVAGSAAALAPKAFAAPAAARPATPAAANPAGLIQRPIPVSGETIPIVGIGTAVIFDFPTSDATRTADRKGVIEAMVAGGATLIDTAPGYGNAEVTVGEAVASVPGAREKLFIATKISGNGNRDQAIASLAASQARLKTQKIDLMQAWNVTNPAYDFGLLKEWKAAGTIRYHGVTTSNDGAYAAIEAVTRSQKPDFVQVDYAIDNASADNLIKVAADNGAAVLINGPFGRNRLFNRVANRPLPDFAAEIGATSWAQFFLKWILGNPSVTAVIPGTDLARYLNDNLGAARGRLPDEAMRKRMADYIAALPAA